MRSPVAPKPRVLAKRVDYAIVASRYNEQFTDALVNNCVGELEDVAPTTRVSIVRVPGAFEIPVTIDRLMHSENKPSVIIALGLIIRGDTAHADLVADAVTKELSALSIRHQIPLIHEVLLVDDEKQAYARCVAENLNRGREAARAAADMEEVFKHIKLADG